MTPVMLVFMAALGCETPVPPDSISLLYGARGDNEIEPCG